MGQTLCSSTPTNQAQLRNSSLLQFQYGQDPRQTKIDHKEASIPHKGNEITKILKETAEKLYESKCMYKDPTIPTERLILKQISSTKSNEKRQIQAIYLRPYQFLNNEQRDQPYKIIDVNDSNANYIKINDEIMQYFGVFLCFLADHTSAIDEIILTHSNTYGLHVVLINDANNRKVPVYIDDYILCNKERPLFAQPVKNIYMWPNLIEKAWFKTHGFMQKLIERNSPEQVFQAFLDHPLKKHSFEGLDQFEKMGLVKSKLYDLNPEYGYILTTKKDPVMHLGISGKKYLYLIGNLIYQNKRVFYVRNPHQDSTFRGTFQQVPEQLKKEIQRNFKDLSIPVGNFIMEESELLEQISCFSIFYYSKSSKIQSFELQFENNNQIFIQTQLKAPGLLSLCLRQESDRRSDKNSRYPPLTYQMIDMSSNEVVCGQQNQEGCFGLHNAYLFSQIVKKLPQSKYLIRLKKKDRKKHYFGTRLTLIATFPKKIDFDIKNQTQFTSIFNETMLKYCRKQFSQQNKRTRGQNLEHQVFVVGDIICIYMSKTNQKLDTCKVQISFPQLKNLELIYPEIDLLKTALLPEPLTKNKSDAILVFQKIDLTEETELGFYQLEAF